jgi:hypothetical protein
VERLTVVAGPDAWTNYMTTNLYASYFSQWAKCSAAKAMLRDSIDLGSWVYPGASVTPTNMIYVTSDGILTNLGAPTNFWDVTPRFNIAMESNGWVFFPRIASNVVWVFDDPFSTLTNRYEASISRYSTNSFLEAYENIATDWGATNNISGDANRIYSYFNAWHTTNGWPLIQFQLIYYKQIGDFMLGYSNSASAFDLISDVWEITTMRFGKGSEAAAVKYWNPESCSVESNYFYRTNLTILKNTIDGPALPYCAEAYSNLASGYDAAASWSETNPGSFTDAHIALEGFEHQYWAVINKYNSTALTNGFKWFR